MTKSYLKTFDILPMSVKTHEFIEEDDKNKKVGIID